MYEKIALL